MKFRILVAYQNELEEEEPWWEEYDKNISDPRRWAKETIKRFNFTRSPSERERLLMRVEVLDVDSRKNHSWEKQNLVTKSCSMGMYDEVKCCICGVTARRYGVSEDMTLDRKYKAKVYARCDMALRHLEKKESRK